MDPGGTALAGSCAAGAEAAALASRLPLGVAINTNEYFPEGMELAEDEGLAADQTTVSSGYFDAMNVPLIYGRDFGEQDRVDAPLVVIVSEAAAQRFWPGENERSEVVTRYWRKAAPASACRAHPAPPC